jgi:hypothetical protein
MFPWEHPCDLEVQQMSDLHPSDTDPQDEAESLDVEEISDDDDDPEGDLAYPPNHLEGVNQYGITEAEQRTDEPLEERISRETPEVFDSLDRDDPSSPGSYDLADPEVGRLLELEDDLDAVAAEQPDLSAEESAVHLTDPDRPAE